MVHLIGGATIEDRAEALCSEDQVGGKGWWGIERRVEQGIHAEDAEAVMQVCGFIDWVERGGDG